MSNIKIEFNIKEILHQIGRTIDELSDKITEIDRRLNTVETRLDFQFSASEEESEKIKGSQKAQIWTLIGGLITAMVGFLTVVGRFIFSKL